MRDERIKLLRDCEAVMVPWGYRVTLPAGSEVEIAQALGGTYTVLTDYGDMVRIAAKDADALGKEAEVAQEAAPQDVDTSVSKAEVEEQVWEQLRTCYDPEIPVNIADLGLIYRCDVLPVPDGGHRIEIDMTLTAPGCGMGDILKTEVEQKLRSLTGVRDVNVDLVFDPPWDMSLLPEAAKLQLGLL